MMTATKIGKDNKESDWSDVRNRAIFYFDDYLLENKKDTINLAKLTQFITLELSLFYLFSDAGKAKRTLSSILHPLSKWPILRRSSRNCPRKRQVLTQDIESVFGNSTVLHLSNYSRNSANSYP